MPDADQRTQLVDLFRETGSAHHRAYIASDGADPDWPVWYAETMQARLNQVLDTALARSELVDLLVLVEKERAANAAAAHWTDYYADFFLERFGAMQGHMPPTSRT
jgi:hypothetical protein